MNGILRSGRALAGLTAVVMVLGEASGGWVVHQGRYEVLVGRSSRDIRGRAGFEVDASRGRPVVP